MNPSELHILKKQGKQKSFSPSLEPKNQISKPLALPSTAKFHISLGEALSLTKAKNDITDAFKKSGFGGTSPGWVFSTDYPLDQSDLFAWNFGIEYNLTHHLRLGVALKKVPHLEIQGRDKVYENGDGTCYGLLIEYVPAPVSPQFISRFEFAVGAGLTYNSLSVDGTLSSIRRGSADVDVESPVSFEVKENIIGGQLRGSLDYYFSRSFSLQFRIDGRFVPAVDIPEISHITHYNIKKTLKQHSVDFSTVDLSLGLRFHL